MKYVGTDLHVIHKLNHHHRRLTDVEQGLKKKEENSLISFQQMERLHKKLKDALAQLHTKKEDLEDFTYKVDNWDRRMESYISYMNESNAENYGKLIDQQDQLWKFERILKEHQDQLWKFERILKEHQEKASLHFSNLEQRIDGIIEILDGDIKREEARDLRLASQEKIFLQAEEKIEDLFSRLTFLEKEISFLHEKIHHKDSTIDYLTNSLESFLSVKKEPMKETIILPENKENSSLMANKEKPGHKRIKSSLTQHFSEHPDKKTSGIPKAEINLGHFQSHDIQKTPIHKKK